MKRNKVFSSITALSVMLSGLSLTASAQELQFKEGFGRSGDFIYYELSDDEAAVVDYVGEDTKVKIPSQIGGFTVTEISGCGDVYESEHPLGVLKGAFEMTDVTDVEIPDTVVKISKNAFFDCDGLMELTVPASVTEIEDKSIGYKLAENGVVPREDFLLKGYSTGVVSRYARENDLRYELVDLPLKEGYFTKGAWICRKLSADEAVIVKYMGEDTEVEIPSQICGFTVTEISGGGDAYESEHPMGVYMGAFENTRVSKVSIPETVVKLGDRAFHDCPELKELTVLSQVEEIGKRAFGLGIGTHDGDKIEGFTVKCYYKSAAYVYAVENDIDYDLLDEKVVYDLDGDEKLTVKDAMKLIAAAFGRLKVPDEDKALYDLNNDSVVNSKDAIMIIRELKK